MAAVIDATVVIPTIGRPRQLATALRSLTACDPRAADVVVVDQSDDPAVSDVIDSFVGVRRVACPGRSIGRAINAGLQAAAHDLVFITNDDCTVAPDWIGIGAGRVAAAPGSLVTGAVLAEGDPASVPSLKDDLRPRDYTGTLACDALYGANMATSRAALLAFGAFDERISPSAEDNDLCYRWLRAGRALQYEPAMRIWHHDWRSPAQLRDLYRAYGRGQGVFYAKHLLARDLRVLRFLARELIWALRAAASSAVRGRRPPDWAEGTLRGLPAGLAAGWRTLRPGRRA